MAFLQRVSRRLPDKSAKLWTDTLRTSKDHEKFRIVGETAAVTPIHEKGDRRKVGNHRPITLLDIESKISRKCIHMALYNHSTFFFCQTSTRICEAQIRSFEHVVFTQKGTWSIGHRHKIGSCGLLNWLLENLYQSTSLGTHPKGRQNRSRWVSNWNPYQLSWKSHEICKDRQF